MICLAHALLSYETWPLPSRVRSTDPVSTLLTAFAQARGVAGSPVPPTRRIGGAPTAVIGPTEPLGLTGQYAQMRLEYWKTGPNNAEALANLGPSASYVATSAGTGRSAQLTAGLASVWLS